MSTKQKGILHRFTDHLEEKSFISPSDMVKSFAMATGIATAALGAVSALALAASHGNFEPKETEDAVVSERVPHN